jgi:hypothetical protein
MLIAHKLLRLLLAPRGPVLPLPVPVPADGPDGLECPVCRARFSCPTDWGTVDDDRWWVLSRCGECGMWSEVRITNAQAARLDDELNRQQAMMARAATRLEADRLAAEVEAFIGALQHDLIDASDFA